MKQDDTSLDLEPQTSPSQQDPQPSLSEREILEKLKEAASAQGNDQMVGYYQFALDNFNKVSQFARQHPERQLPVMQTPFGWVWLTRQQRRKLMRGAQKNKRDSQ